LLRLLVRAANAAEKGVARRGFSETQGIGQSETAPAGWNEEGMKKAALEGAASKSIQLPSVRGKARRIFLHH